MPSAPIVKAVLILTASSPCFLTWILAEKKTDITKINFCLEIVHLGMRWPVSKEFLSLSKQSTSSKRNQFSKPAGCASGHKEASGVAGNVLFLDYVCGYMGLHICIHLSKH